jgi:hypothetical protein
MLTAVRVDKRPRSTMSQNKSRLRNEVRNRKAHPCKTQTRKDGRPPGMFFIVFLQRLGAAPVRYHAHQQDVLCDSIVNGLEYCIHA